MNEQKIAIMTDSCADVPADLVKEYGMYVLPLKIIYGDKEYLDGVDIGPDEVYGRMPAEVPTTSLPDGNCITKMLDKIKQDGYEKVLAVTISSGLSGTYNVVSMVAARYEGLEVYVLDTKNIAIASGFSAIQAAEYLREGMDWETLKKTVTENVSKSKVFFCVSTLEYLRKGGRIGLVASILGSAFNLKPIISCNEDGVYYNAAKVRGRKQSINETMMMAVRFAGSSKKYNMALMHGAAKEEAEDLRPKFKEALPQGRIYVEGQISPALGVHTGPGLIGIAVQVLD